MNGMGKRFRKNPIQKIEKTGKIKVKTISVKVKFGLNKKTRPRLNNEWIGKTIK